MKNNPFRDPLAYRGAHAVAFSCLENSKCELMTKFWPY